MGINRLSPGCGCCATDTFCELCQPGTAPNTVTVTLSGVTDNNCDKCSSFNATFVLSRNTVGISCYWITTMLVANQTCSGILYWNLWDITAQVIYSAGNYYWQFAITRQGDTSGVEWLSAPYASKPNCSTTPVTVSFNSDSKNYCVWPTTLTLHMA